MGDLGEQDGYPVGTSNADVAGEEGPCGRCHHLADDHDPDGCTICDCPHHIPEEDDRA